MSFASTPPPPALRLIRLREVQARTGVGRSTIYQRIRAGRFPEQVQLGNPYIVGWVESEIQLWIEHQIAAARAEPDRPGSPKEQ